MKKKYLLIFIIAVLLSFMNCTQEIIMSFEDAINYTRVNIMPFPEPDGLDVWQYPETTIERGAGDCEDIAGVIMYYSGQGRFACGYRNGIDHAAVKYEGRYYDITGDITEQFRNVYTLSYQGYLRRCTE